MQRDDRDIVSSEAGVGSHGTIVDVLRWRAAGQSGRVAYAFLSGPDGGEVSISYGELDRRARAVAAFLEQNGLYGQTALLLLPSGLDYVVAFFGCLYAGVVAIPAFPVRVGRARRGEPWLRAVVDDAGPQVAFATRESIENVRRSTRDAAIPAGLKMLSVDEVDLAQGDVWRRPDLGQETLAYLQYTSGSTSAPKGVMINHSNIRHNLQAIQAAYNQDENSTVVSWLPLHHDMGLVGSLLQPVYIGARSILMSPSRFLQNPATWLRAISSHHARSSSAPNFAYELCCKRVSADEKHDLNLSTWTIAVNGAEPVRWETMQHFADSFQNCGFDLSAFRPSYGLAESTLMVTGARSPAFPLARRVSVQGLESHSIQEPHSGQASRFVVGCGSSVLGQEITIVDPVRRELCLEGSVGEIWLSGPSVAQGYWKRERETEEVFRLRLSNGDGPFLSTGDLGFVHEGQLFVTGRLKDLIIIHGRNFHSEDIELTVQQSHPAIPLASVAAFVIEAEDEERLVVVAEVEKHRQPSPEDIVEAVRNALLLEHGIVLYGIVLVNRGNVPKTTSGKIKRAACRVAFLQGQLDVLWSAVGPSDRTGDLTTEDLSRQAVLRAAPDTRMEVIEIYLRSCLARLCRVHPDSIPRDSPLVAVGLDSLAVVELSSKIETDLGVRINSLDLLHHLTFNELLANALDQFNSREARVVSSSGSARNVETRFPLSYGQQGLWVSYELAPQSAVYNLAGAAWVRSELDVHALQRAVLALMARHDALRTTFANTPDGPVQIVSTVDEIALDAHLRYVDCSSKSTPLNDLLTAEIQVPFALEKSPPIRFVVLKYGDEHVLLLVLHHMIADFWSMNTILGDLGKLYAKECGLSDVLLTESPRYVDFVEWQRANTRGEEEEAHWEFWKQKFSYEIPNLQLPVAEPSLPVSRRGCSELMALDLSLYRKLESIARANNATPFVILLAAFQILLHRLSGCEDLAVGVPTSGRNDSRFLKTVGYFVNPVALHSHYDGNLPFLTYLQQSNATALEAFRHRDYPFPRLVERLHRERLAGASPIFQAMFVWQESSEGDPEALKGMSLGHGGMSFDLGGLSLESIGLQASGSQFELTLMMTELSVGLVSAWKYDPQSFEASGVRHMAQQFRVLLEAIATNPSMSLSELPMVGDEEWRCLQSWGSANTAVRRPDRCVHQLFEDQVRHSPHRAALVVGEKTLSFAQLNARANQFARYLRKLQVDTDIRVGLLLNRSVELIVALLGIWKAGGAYVPMDAGDPKERLAGVIEQSEMQVLITHEHLLDRIPDQLPQSVLLDLDLDLIAEEDELDLDVAVPRESLAYVIYTSGSTGHPKGVMIEHRSIINLLESLRTTIYDQQGSEHVVVGLNAPLSFDSSVKQIITLALGHTLVVLPEEIRRNGLALLEYLVENEVSVVDCTPAQVQLLMETGFGRTPNRVSLLVGGEPIPDEMWRFLASTSASYNVYGPTECTVDATCCKIAASGRPSIGRPLDGTNVFLLDENWSPVPIGAPGEIFLGGPGVGRGYLQHPEWTADRFVPNPFSPARGSRLYRTGDRARWRTDGTLQFIGRADRQVKIRGFRIELEEVEAVLRRCPGVTDAAATIREEGTGNKQLIAYVVSSEPDPATEYRRFLRRHLPNYMVPVAVVTLPRLPANSHGKIDYSALPVPTTTALDRQDDYAAPRSALEKALVELWTDALRVQPIGIEDNFFELGGDSLQATKLIARVQDCYPTQVPLLTVFFEDPTIATLSRALSSAGIAEEPSIG